MNRAIWLAIIPVVFIIIILMWYVGTYNSLIKLDEEVDNKWAQVETQYQRRVDLIPNLVNTVRGSAAFESSTLEEITALRSRWQQATSVDEKVETANQIESALSRLLVVVENYPQLRSTENFLALQDELANTENKIAVERMRYNEVVRTFNARIKTLPTNIVASNMGFTEMSYFEATAGSEEAPEVDFE